MIEKLLKYDAIAWDFDGTLMDHRNSTLMHKFIIEQPTKRHVILTFRSHGIQHSMFHELLRVYPHAPGPQHFAKVENISDKAFEEFDKVNRFRLFRAFRGPMTLCEAYYLEWKGMMCHKLHLPVLVDDLTAYVLPGCKKYKIDYLHPDEL